MFWLNWTDSILPALRVNIQPARLIDTILACIERNQQRRALARLDDRLLADIGRSHADVQAECEKPCWRE